MNRPLLISPVDRGEEALPLLDAGADELYGGYVPPAWRQRFGLLGSINQRTFDQAQLQSAAELEQVVAAVHRQGRRFFLTLNTPFYSEPQFPLLEALVDEAVEIGSDGIILADLVLLRRLRRRHPRLEFHASTLAHLSNSRALALYRDAGIARAVLPRHLNVGEIEAIRRACPDCPVDVFLLVGKCPNTEGLCTFHHAAADRIWPCEIPYATEALHPPASRELEAAMARQRSWSASDRRHGCGLCAIPALLHAGVAGLKLVGRGAATAQKVRNLLLCRDFLDLAAAEPAGERYRELARAAHQARFGSPCSPNVCYYPEFYEAE